MATAVTRSPLMTVAEAAQLLHVSERTVRRLISAGAVPALRVGSQIRIDRDELHRWLYDEKRGRNEREHTRHARSGRQGCGHGFASAGNPRRDAATAAYTGRNDPHHMTPRPDGLSVDTSLEAYGQRRWSPTRWHPFKTKWSSVAVFDERAGKTHLPNSSMPERSWTGRPSKRSCATVFSADVSAKSRPRDAARPFPC